MNRPSPIAALIALCREPLVRGALLLGLACTLSALAVSYYAAQMRVVFRSQQAAVHERDELLAERGRLMLEKGAFSSYSHVERVAAGKLGMRVPNADETRLVLR